MAGLDDLADQVAADVGATPDAPSASPASSAVPDSAPAGAERADTDLSAKDTKSETEQIVDRFLEGHPAKDDNEWDPVQPKTAPSDGADKSVSPETPADTTPTDDAPTDGSEKPEVWLTKEEMAALGPKAKARIETLWRENREHRQFVDQADPFLKPIRDNGLPLSDVQIMAQLAGAVNRQDWGTFWKATEPYFNLARQALGLELPDDLKTRVDEGEMTTEAASELSKARHAAAGATVRAQQLEQQRETERQAGETRQAQESSNLVTKAVNDWEGQQRATDPDYQRLRPLILDKMVAFVASNGPPPTPDHGIRLANWAKQEVLKVARAGSPTPKATTAHPSANGSAKAPLRAEPKNVYEHVFNRLGIS
jgi:hypothetical protein